MGRPKTENEELQKHTLLLYRGDFEKLGTFFPEIGASVAIRRIIRASLRKLESGISSLPKEINIE